MSSLLQSFHQKCDVLPAVVKGSAALLYVAFGYMFCASLAVSAERDETLGQSDPSTVSHYEKNEGCMVSHLREAKAINLDRMPRYAELTDGASRRISWILIGSESMGIPFAAWLEYLNRPLAKVGVNILCEDFVSMELTPIFRARAQDKPLPINQFTADRGWDDFGDLWRLSRERAYGELARHADVVLAELALVPPYHCMYRHILESLRLAALKADGQFARARAQGLGDRAEFVVDALVMSQVAVLPLAIYLDTVAAPLHAQGIPIICQDVPPIPAQ